MLNMAVHRSIVSTGPLQYVLSNEAGSVNVSSSLTFVYCNLIGPRLSLSITVIERNSLQVKECGWNVM